MSIKERSKGSWQVDVMLSGTRYRHTFASEADAMRWETEARIAHKQGLDIPIPTTIIVQGGWRIETMEDLYKIVARDRWSNRKSGEMLALNGELFLRWVGRKKVITEITSEDLHSYVEYCRSIGNAPGTINRKLSSVKVMLKEAMHRGIISKVPYVTKQREKSGSLDYLEFGEEDPIINQMLRMGFPQYAHLVSFLVDTGCRIGEALRLEYRTVGDTRVRFEDRKSGRFGVVPMTKRAQAAIKWCSKNAPHPDKPFGNIDYRLMLTHFRKVYEILGDRYANIQQPFHIFRHTCASRLAIRGVDANRIKEWMDHSTLTVTQRYMKLAPTDLDIAAEALEPQDKNLRIIKGSKAS